MKKYFAMNFYQNLTPPTIKFCEENVNSWVMQPANAWSNLPMFLVGIFLLYITRKSQNILIRSLPWIMILIGLFSFIYHASFTFMGQILDLSSMFLLSSYLLIFNLKRLSPQKYKQKALVYLLIGLSIISVAFVYFFRTIGGFNIGIPIFVLQILTVIILEYRIRKLPAEYDLKFFFLAIATIALGQIVWWLDFSRVWCNQSYFHLINGHSLWHILSAVCFIFLYLFYKQFESLKD